MSAYRTPEELEQFARSICDLYSQETITAKERRAIPQQPMSERPAELRIKDMLEVPAGYSDGQAKAEALRCLQCKTAPCKKGCPVGIDIPGFLNKAAQGDFDGALAIIRETNMFPAICGRVCPQEKQCMSQCTIGKIEKDPLKAVAIGRIERFLADRDREAGGTPVKGPEKETGKNVAIVGSGPSGLAAAGDLRKEGHRVTVYECFPKAGGVTVYGIPEFRLPKAIVQNEVDNLKAMGVEIVTDTLIGRTITVDELLGDRGFDAVYIATGAGLPRFMNLEGENLVGVLSANEFLTRVNLMRAYEKEKAATPLPQVNRVAVFGAGNVAMDAARTAKRLGAETVKIIYRRSEEEMPARAEELHHAKEEGIEFELLSNPVRILGNEEGRVTGLVCQKYELGEPDESGRRRPVPIEGSEYTIEVDTCIPAIGNDSNPLISQTTPEIETSKRGNILVDESQKTSLDKVYAGGDIVLGAATVILAMGQGRNAARAINDQLKD